MFVSLIALIHRRRRIISNPCSASTDLLGRQIRFGPSYLYGDGLGCKQRIAAQSLARHVLVTLKSFGGHAPENVLVMSIPQQEFRQLVTTVMFVLNLRAKGPPPRMSKRQSCHIALLSDPQKICGGLGYPQW